MAIYDISLPISETLIVWPGDERVKMQTVSSLERGDVATVTHLAFSAHTGTHVDAPKHFIREGGSVDTLSLESLVGPALVVDVGDVDVITAEVLAAQDIPAGVERVLFRTRNSALWAQGVGTFHEQFVAIDGSGAEWLVARGVRLVGIDYLSVGPFDAPRPTHVALLGNNVVVVEGLDLSAIEPDWYTLICLPLRLSGVDGAPARAVLIDAESLRC